MTIDFRCSKLNTIGILPPLINKNHLQSISFPTGHFYLLTEQGEGHMSTGFNQSHLSTETCQCANSNYSGKTHSSTAHLTVIQVCSTS